MANIRASRDFQKSDLGSLVPITMVDNGDGTYSEKVSASVSATVTTGPTTRAPQNSAAISTVVAATAVTGVLTAADATRLSVAFCNLGLKDVLLQAGATATVAGASVVIKAGGGAFEDDLSGSAWSCITNGTDTSSVGVTVFK